MYSILRTLILRMELFPNPSLKIGIGVLEAGMPALSLVAGTSALVCIHLKM